MTCPHCHGTGRITLLTSEVACECQQPLRYAVWDAGKNTWTLDGAPVECVGGWPAGDLPCVLPIESVA